MEINTDIILPGEIWGKVKSPEIYSETNQFCIVENGFFTRLVDVYIVAAAIGVKEDKIRVINKEDNMEVNSISRNTIGTHEDLSYIINYLFQIAVLTTSHLEYSNEERLKCAFDPDFKMPGFSPQNFLTNFANYGIEKLLECTNENNILAIENVLNLIKTENIDDSIFQDTMNILDEIEA